MPTLQRMGTVLVAALFFATVAWTVPPKVPTAPVMVTVGGKPVQVTIDTPVVEFAAAAAFSPEACLWFPGESAAGKKTYLIQAYQKGIYRVIFWSKGETEYSTLIIDASGGTTPAPPVDPPDTPAAVAKHLSFVGVNAASVTTVVDIGLREYLKSVGISVHVVAANDVDKYKMAAAVAKAGGLPCVVVQDATGNVIDQSKLTTVEAVKTLVGKYVK